MGVIKKVGDGVKRLCAVLVACVVMWYSVITAPVFRVGAVNQGDDIATIGTSFITFILGLATLGEAPVLSPVVGASLGLALPLVVDAVASSNNPGVSAPVQLPKSIPSQSLCGYYINQDYPSESRQVTLYQYVWDYSALDTSYGVMCDTLVSCQDFQIGLYVTPSDDWLSSSSRENIDLRLTVNYANATRSSRFYPVITATDSSGVTPSFDFTFVVTFADNSFFQKSYSYSGSTFSNYGFYVPLRSGASVSYSQSGFQSVFLQAFGSGSDALSSEHNLTVGSNSATVVNAVIPSSQYPSLPSPIYSTEQAINYYDNSVRPYVINNYSSTYPEYTEQYITYQEYYDSLDPAPSETTSPGTGVIIIDPFTLPPEWVESDVVELETDHYEVPFESMVADPFDYLVSPYTQTSTETVRGAMKTVPISPPTPQYQVFPSSGNVQETAVGFVNLAYTLLNRSGLDYVIGIAVFGLCVSLLVL